MTMIKYFIASEGRKSKCQLDEADKKVKGEYSYPPFHQFTTNY